VTAIGRLLKPLTEPSEGLSLHVGRDVRLGVHRVGYLRVPEDFLDDLRVLPLLEHPRSEGMPKIVEADRLRQPILLEERLEVAPGGVVPTHGGALLGRENEIIVLPQTLIFEPLLGLALAVTLEGLHCLGQQGDRAPLLGLGPLEDWAVGALREASLQARDRLGAV
jgi:hypothetical protein